MSEGVIPMVEEIDIMWVDDVMTHLWVDWDAKTLRIENHMESRLHLPFGKFLNPSWEQFERFLSSRVFPRNRRNAKVLLDLLDLDVYDPMAICRKTHGTTSSDHMWLRFNGEELTFSDVSTRDLCD